MNVPGQHQYYVEEYFLEDILKRTKYMSNAMKKLKSEAELKKWQCLEREKWTTCVTDGVQQEPVRRSEQRAIQTPVFGQQREHSQTSVTPLMVAAGRGSVNTAEQLLSLGANTNFRASNEWTALDWARSMKQNDVMELIEAYMKAESKNVPVLLPANDANRAEKDEELLDIYHHSFNDDRIDVDLLMTILHEVHSSQEEGTILVFVSGYDDIVALRERIIAEKRRLIGAHKYRLYILHSNMQIGDQMRVFDPAPPGVRKIVLLTNIVETSVTIDDVMCVIDSGKVREESCDAISGACMLRLAWISQARSKQRKGRAGRTRPGVCYHMFSETQYRALQQYNTPEILRMPLQELCLHAKLLATAGTPIANFLGRAIEPPLPQALTNAVQLLKTIDVLDSWEGLTELGHHLLDLPVEPRLGKMLLFSIVLKCLDPVLTIVCCLAHRDAFVLPAQPSEKQAAYLSRKKYSAGTYSDHMALLQAFQAWQAARKMDQEREICNERFISAPTMEMVYQMRVQLMKQMLTFGFIERRANLNSNSENWAVVKAALCAGTYPNLIRVDREHRQLRTQKESRVLFHPSSTLCECPTSPHTSHSAVVASLPSEWLIYEEISRSGRFRHARCCTVLSPITVALFAGPARMPQDRAFEAKMCCGGGVAESESDGEVEDRPDRRDTTLELDEWAVLHFDAEAAHLVIQLRQELHSLFLRRTKALTKPCSEVDEAVLKAVVSVLTAKEQELGLQRPRGIGRRPLSFTIRYNETVCCYLLE